MKIYLTIHPSDGARASNSKFHSAHMAYKIKALHLLRGSLASNTKSGIMVITDIDTAPAEGSFKSLSAEIYNECLRRGFDGVVLDFDPKPTSDTSPFASRLCTELCKTRLNIYVPYLYSVFCPDAKYIVSSAISGGSLREHLEKLVQIHGRQRLVVETARVAMDFNMPSASSEGKVLSKSELEKLLESSQAFYSPELCSNYFTYSDQTGQAHFVLFDDARSIADKLKLANALGFSAAFLLYHEIEDIFPELISYSS